MPDDFACDVLACRVVAISNLNVQVIKPVPGGRSDHSAGLRRARALLSPVTHAICPRIPPGSGLTSSRVLSAVLVLLSGKLRYDDQLTSLQQPTETSRTPRSHERLNLHDQGLTKRIADASGGSLAGPSLTDY